MSIDHLSATPPGNWKALPDEPAAQMKKPPEGGSRNARECLDSEKRASHHEVQIMALPHPTGATRFCATLNRRMHVVERAAFNVARILGTLALAVAVCSWIAGG